MRNVWTPEEDNIIKNNYITLELKDICKLLLHRSYNAIRGRQTFLGICKKYIKNEDFFYIPNILNSSIAGFIASDGHLSVTKDNTYRLQFGINTKDKELLTFINQSFQSNYKISDSIKKRKFIDKKNNKIYEYIDYKSTLHISSANKWCQDLYKNWNIPIGAKSLILEPPVNLINLDCCLAYIKGLIIGDGSIIITSDGNQKYIRISLLGTQKLLLWCKEIFEKFLNKQIESEVRPERNNKSTLFTLNINCIAAARIIEKMNSLETLTLDRKFKKPEVLQIIQQTKQKHLNLFSGLNTIKKLLNDYNIIFNEKEDYLHIPSKNLNIRIVDIFKYSSLNNCERIQLRKDSPESINNRFINIYETELKLQPKIVISRLKHYLGLIKRNIYARKCDIREIDGQLKNKFLNKYHIQGEDYGSNIYLGLYYKNRLVSVMTFGKKGVSYDLMRFSGNNHFNIVGGASKLLDYFEKKYNPQHIYSFADKRWSNGHLYYQLGFQKTKENEPSYFYFQSNKLKLYHKFGFRRKYLIKKISSFIPSLSEWENMKVNGWNRVWDCGLLKFEKCLQSNRLIPFYNKITAYPSECAL